MDIRINKKEKLILFLSWFILFCAILVRVFVFVQNRSLWFDEATLSNNIVNKTILDFFYPLDRIQIAPFLFLVFQKYTIYIFGNSDWALRIIPLITGIGVLFLFYAIARKYFSGIVLIFSLLFISFNPSLIYYSSEAKQYSSDIFSFLIIAYLFIKFNENSISWKNIFIFGIIGSILIWFSFSTYFIITSVSITLLIKVINNENRVFLKRIIILLSMWFVSFIVYYIVFISNQASYSIQQSNFTQLHAFIPLNSGFINLFIWLGKFLISLFYPFGFSFSISLVFFIFIIGFFKILIDKNIEIIVIVLSLLVQLILSALRLYPIGGRLSVYILPLTIIVICFGIDWLIKGELFRKIIIVSSLFFLLIIPIINKSTISYKPHNNEEIKKSLKILQEKSLNNDIIYVYYGTLPAYEFYSKRYNINGIICKGSNYRNNPDMYITEIDSNFKNNSRSNLWILFSHDYRRVEKDYIITHLNYKLKEKFLFHNSYLYCFVNNSTKEKK